MGVATELEADVGLFCVVEVVRLVVEEDGEGEGVFLLCGHLLLDGECVWNVGYQFFHALAMEVGAVVASDNDEGIVEGGDGVDEQMDACVAIELLGLGTAAVVFVVAETSIDGGVEAMKFGCHIFFDEGSDASVDDVASNEDEVGVFGIDKVNPSSEFFAWVVIAEVEVAEHHDLIGSGKGLVGGQLEGHTHFVVVVEVAIEEGAEDDESDGCGGVPVGVEEGAWQEMNESAEVEQEEDEGEIEHDENG